MTQIETPARAATEVENPWPALFALVLGSFMSLVGLTTVIVATPTESAANSMRRILPQGC